MSKHEFGIMQINPTDKEVFNEYEPSKYNCIVIDDDFIEPILIELQNVDTYWHTIQNKKNGLAYSGITLIPPSSIDVLINILSLKNMIEYDSLIYLLNQAKKYNKYVIHFGI